MVLHLDYEPDRASLRMSTLPLVPEHVSCYVSVHCQDEGSVFVDVFGDLHRSTVAPQDESCFE
jgi:hypothetical protein